MNQLITQGTMIEDVAVQTISKAQPICPLVKNGLVQRTAVKDSPVHEVPPIVYGALRSPGQPLDAETRSFMEPRFGQDFSNVRIHNDRKAAESAQAVNALAYTVGRGIVFGTGQYAPQLSSGRKLIAHELVHVAQQRNQHQTDHTKMAIGKTNSTEECQADLMSSNIERDPSFQNHIPTSDNTITHLQRQAAPNAQERQFWLNVGKQPNYGVLPKDKRAPMVSKARTGTRLPADLREALDEIAWTIEASFVRADKLRTSLKSHFGTDKELNVTSVVKDGEHTAYRKMDVARAGTTTWEELAAAAVSAGFWVHAEGVVLDGKFWPLSPKATGPHLDLYLIRTAVGDFPTPKDTPLETKNNKNELT